MKNAARVQSAQGSDNRCNHRCGNPERRWLKFVYPIWQWLVLIPLVVLLTIMTALIVVVMCLFGWQRAANVGVAATWARLIVWLTPVRVEIEGADHIVPGTRYVLVANHQSQYDIPVVYGFSGLDLRWVMKAELGKVPMIAHGCRAIGHIFIDRSDPGKAREKIRRAVERLPGGASVLFFAEGTRSPTGQLIKFRKGAFQIAVEQGMPVLPVTIVGTRRILEPGSLRIRPGRVRLVFHAPLEPPSGAKSEAIEDLCRQTREKIGSALAESRQTRVENHP